MPLIPPVGVVVANHNNARFVGEAIESAVRQTVRGLDVVIIDDASTDNSDEVIRDCLARLGDSRFRYVRLAANVGQGGALRAGLAKLDTPFVCFLDSGDYWYDNFIERHLAAHLNDDFPVALTYCDSHIVDAEGRMLAATSWFFDSDEPDAKEQRTIAPALVPTIDGATGEVRHESTPRLTYRPSWSTGSSTNTTAAMMFRRSFVDLVFVAPDDALRLYVDFYLGTFACLLTGVISIHQPLNAYRMHGKNLHSNAGVPGGAYNTSMREWQPIRDEKLKVIQTVLREHADILRLTFGDDRHALANAIVASVVGNEVTEEQPQPQPPSRGTALRHAGPAQSDMSTARAGNLDSRGHIGRAHGCRRRHGAGLRRAPSRRAEQPRPPCRAVQGGQLRLRRQRQPRPVPFDPGGLAGARAAWPTDRPRHAAKIACRSGLSACRTRATPASRRLPGSGRTTIIW